MRCSRHIHVGLAALLLAIWLVGCAGNSTARPPMINSYPTATLAPTPTRLAPTVVGLTQASPKPISAAYFGIFNDGDSYDETLKIQAQIPWHQIDRLYIAFATLNANGDLTNIEINGSANLADDRIRTLVDLYRRANPHGEIFISSNYGDDMDERYLRAATHPQQFAQRAQSYLQKYDLDGYDMDWETRQINTYASQLKTLLEACHKTFQRAGKNVRGKTLQVTHAVWPGVHSPETVASLKDSVDGINLMTYGTGDAYALDDFATQYNAAGFPFEKMFAGVESELGYADNDGTDTQASVATKANFVRENNLGGMFSWRLDNDLRTQDNATASGPSTFRVAGWVYEEMSR